MSTGESMADGAMRAICQEDLGRDEETVVLLCAHPYHASCINTYAEVHQKTLATVSCPVCKSVGGDAELKIDESQSTQVDLCQSPQ